MKILLALLCSFSFTAAALASQGGWQCDSGFLNRSLHGGVIARLAQNVDGTYALSVGLTPGDTGGTDIPLTLVNGEMKCVFSKTDEKAAYCEHSSAGGWTSLRAEYETILEVSTDEEHLAHVVRVTVSSNESALLKSINKNGVLIFGVNLDLAHERNFCGLAD